METTIFQKGNPFSRKNMMWYVGVLPLGGSSLMVRVDEFPKADKAIREGNLLVGFNLKFDLHWMKRYGYSFQDMKVWDCQLAHFLLTSQQDRYPSLEGVCAYYGLEGKLDIVRTEYWENGIDTPDIPSEVMFKYLDTDLIRTAEVYQKQLEEFKKNPKLYTLFRIQCADLHVLQEMEWNGLLLDTKKAHEEGAKLNARVVQLEEQLDALCPRLALNWDSGDDLSCFLYGGTIVREHREIAGVFKTGTKIGQPRYRVIRVPYEMPRLCEPIKGSELQKEGYWSTDEKMLRQLKGVKKIVDLLLERSKCVKLLDYFDGLPKLIEEMDWKENEVHGQLNQCVAITGRLSATKPNQQNQPPEVKELIISRYND